MLDRSARNGVTRAGVVRTGLRVPALRRDRGGLAEGQGREVAVLVGLPLLQLVDDRRGDGVQRDDERRGVEYCTIL